MAVAPRCCVGVLHLMGHQMHVAAASGACARRSAVCAASALSGALRTAPDLEPSAQALLRGANDVSLRRPNGGLEARPIRLRARTCCSWSSPKMSAIPGGDHRCPDRVRVLGRHYLTGRFSAVHGWAGRSWCPSTRPFRLRKPLRMLTPARFHLPPSRWGPLRRIEQATGVRRETVSAYLKAAAVAIRASRRRRPRP